ncbi:MAG: hypothetical protein JSV32_06455 [Dehalococcoidia bacterium]|nr:MAG: hypothetical protein JSV32_06455 [Dehalococcoidia bacterium]
MKITKKLVKEYLRDKLSTNDAWALRCLEVIYDHQTPGEQVAETTNCDNGIGFTGADAEILTSFAKQYAKYKKLSPKQMEILKKKTKKYWKQVLELTDQKKLLKCMIMDGVIEAKDAFVSCL